MKKRTFLPIAGICLIFLFIFAAIILYRLSGPRYAAPVAVSVPVAEPVTCERLLNTYSSLSVPTQITQIGEDYFLVDCYHNQILTSNSLDAPLTEWYVMTDRINRGHTIAGNGTVYLADDTENNRILIFEKKEGNFYLTQTFDDIGIRPHFVAYDEESCRFYALSSMTGELYVFYQSGTDTTVKLEKILTLPELKDIYVRSFTIDGDIIYFTACNGQILETRKKDLQVLNRYTVPDEIAGMVQLTKAETSFLLTVSTDLYGNAEFATILQFDTLTDLSNGLFDDISHLFTKGGTPYYISGIDGQFFMTQHCMQPGSGVWQFQITDNTLTDIAVLFP